MSLPPGRNVVTYLPVKEKDPNVHLLWLWVEEQAWVYGAFKFIQAWVSF